MATVQELVVLVTANTKQFQSGMAKAEATTSSFGTVAKVGLGLAAIAAVKFGADSVDAFTESQQIMAQTVNVLKSTGGQANVTAGQIANMANSLRDMTGIDDEAIQASSNLLLTFRAVTNEVGKGNDIFNQAQGAILDMATALNEGAVPSTEDLHSATLQLGKALNDPITGLTALRRAGVSFTAQQTEQIKAMVESGNLMGAQKRILAELSKEFGGAAKAAGKTFGGQMAILGSKIGDVQEKIGRFLVPILIKLARVAELAADHIKVLAVAGLAFAAWKFIPPLFAAIGDGAIALAAKLEAVGAVGLANVVLSASAGISSLVGALGLASGAALTFAGAWIGLTAAVAAWDPLNLVGDVNELRTSMEVHGQVLGRVARSTNLSATANSAWERSMTEGANASTFAKGSIEALNTAQREGAGWADNAAIATMGLAAAHKQAADAARDQRLAEKALVDPLFAVLDSSDQLAEAQREVNRLKSKGAQGTERYKDAVLTELEAAHQAKTDLAAYAQALNDATVKHGAAVRQVQALGHQLGLEKSDIRAVINEIFDLPKTWTTKITANTSSATSQIVSLQDRLNQLTANDYELRVGVTEVHHSPTPTEFIKQTSRGLHDLTDNEWSIRVGAKAPKIGASVGAPSGASSGGGRTDGARSLVVRLDRRRFADELTFDGTYKGYG